MNFLDLNEIPSEIDDVRVLHYINDHERLVKGLFLPFLFDQRVTISFFRYHSMCAARLHRHCLLIYVDLTLAQVLFADMHHTRRRCESLREHHRRAHRTSLLASVFELCDALNNYQNESSVDEFLRVLFCRCQLQNWCDSSHASFTYCAVGI
jgi:hypothetical protein